MKTYKKNYIGKGNQVPNLSIAKCTVKVEEILKFKHEFEGVEYVTFEVAKMKQEDKYGRDYTVYCTTHEEVADEKPVEEPIETPKKIRKKTAKAK